MTPKQYSEKAIRLDSNYPSVNARLHDNALLQKLMHGAMGLTGESGEVADMIKKSIIYGKELNVSKLREECGDVLWYMNVILLAIGSSFEEAMSANIEKLQKRYPDGFSESDALDRKDTKC